MFLRCVEELELELAGKQAEASAGISLSEEKSWIAALPWSREPHRVIIVHHIAASSMQDCVHIHDQIVAINGIVATSAAQLAAMIVATEEPRLRVRRLTSFGRIYTSWKCIVVLLPLGLSLALLSIFIAGKSAAKCAEFHRPKQSIPSNLVMNYKAHMRRQAQTNPLIVRNVKRSARIYSNWTFTFDDDSSCLVKISNVLTLLMDLDARTTARWYKTAPGKYKSDLCRLAQLYQQGGVYLDNDIQLMHPLPVEGCSFVTAVPESDKLQFFQAMLAATPRHPIIRRALIYFGEFIQGKRTTGGRWAGPAILFSAFSEYQLQTDLCATGKATALSFTTSERMANGACLLTERRLTPEERRQLPHRRMDGLCDAVVTWKGRAVAFSRSISYGGNDTRKRACDVGGHVASERTLALSDTHADAAPLRTTLPRGVLALAANG